MSSGSRDPGEQAQRGMQLPAPQKLEVPSPRLPWGMHGGGGLLAMLSRSLTPHLFICPVGVRAACRGPGARPGVSRSEARPVELEAC